MKVAYKRKDIFMKQVSVTLSTYTADVSGVCSALYELGGMVVIHDPSGCNSTYNTHDEPRWYDMDSLVFISGLSQMDAIMGNDDKFIQDIVRAAKELNPRFIALVRTPIPLMTGTDFEGITRVIEKQTGIPVFYFPTSGMHSYVSGAGMALETVARELVLPSNINIHFKEPKTEVNTVSDKLTAGSTEKQRQPELKLEQNPVDLTMGQIKDKSEPSIENESKQPVQRQQKCIKSDSAKKIKIKTAESKPGNTKIKINILGATPLDFSVNSTLDSIKEFLSHHFEIISTFAMGSTIEEIQKASEADVNLVISSVGFPAAKVLEERFHIPYVIGTPVKGFENIIAEKMLGVAWTKQSQTAYFSVALKEEKKCTGNIDNEPIVPKTKILSKSEKMELAEKIEKPETIEIIETPAEIINKEKSTNEIYIIGEAVISQSLKAALVLKHGINAKVICPLETEPEYIGEDVLLLSSEEEIKEAIAEAQTVIADPIYKTVCSEKTNFISLPHEAFSGRIYRKEIPNLMNGVPI